VGTIREEKKKEYQRRERVKSQKKEDAGARKEKASLQILFKCPRPANVFETATRPSRLAHFWQGAEPLAPAPQKHRFNVQKLSKHVVLSTC
jgi:hypothetical protein